MFSLKLIYPRVENNKMLLNFIFLALIFVYSEAKFKKNLEVYEILDNGKKDLDFRNLYGYNYGRNSDLARLLTSVSNNPPKKDADDLERSNDNIDLIVLSGYDGVSQQLSENSDSEEFVDKTRSVKVDSTEAVKKLLYRLIPKRNKGARQKARANLLRSRIEFDDRTAAPRHRYRYD